ncbi:MAG TPA: GGDEF domain-containing protein [Burkholderiales bacterium]|nr:GGDEF domain-containing protein [Burkholderiales bacterium]
MALPVVRPDWLTQEVMHGPLQNEQHVFLSTKPASRADGRNALAALLVSAVIFLAAAPFAGTLLVQVPAFAPTYMSVLVICELLTSVLLYGQFRFLRSRALLVLAGGYLFTACITVAQALVFPGLFSPSGLLDAGTQSAAWLFVFGHGGFPAAVIAYARLEDHGLVAIASGGRPRAYTRFAIPYSIAAILAIVCALTLLVTAGQEFLPVIIQGNRIAVIGRIVRSSAWVLTALALYLLWRRWPRTVIDLWLMVVMCVWLMDITLAGLLNTGRFDLGWYAARVYDVLAASTLLIVLLIENGKHYARLAQLSAELRAANVALEQLSMHDGLTGLANRRCFDKYIASQIAVARRYERPLALVMCDVDAFKAYNDHYGHQAGDECLKQVAAALRSRCRRPADMAARYGGEEFVLVLPDTDLGGAAQIAEAARDAIWQLRIVHAHSPAAPYLSISGGVAVLLRNVDMTAQQLIADADRSLYQAKQLGRNRMVCAQAEPAYQHA